MTNLIVVQLYHRSSLHTYLLSSQPPSPELVAGVALVARLTALLEQFPNQVQSCSSTFTYDRYNSLFQAPPAGLVESVHLLSSLLFSLDSKIALGVVKLIETW